MRKLTSEIIPYVIPSESLELRSQRRPTSAKTAYDDERGRRPLWLFKREGAASVPFSVSGAGAKSAAVRDLDRR